MKKYIFFLPLLIMMLHAFGVAAADKITVAVAANMQFAMEELKNDFEKKTGITVEMISGSSGKLSSQIIEGAPFDVFVSADMKYPEDLYKKGFATDAPKPYATGQLVLWTTKMDLKLNGDLKILLLAAVKKIAIANPKTAPYGIAAIEALNYYKIYDEVKDKLVFGESIGQTQQFIATQAAEVGFIAKSLVLADELKGQGQWVDVDKKAYSPITQGAVILKHGKETNDNPAQKFYQFLYSAKAKSVFKKYGYIVNGL